MAKKSQPHNKPSKPRCQKPAVDAAKKAQAQSKSDAKTARPKIFAFVEDGQLHGIRDPRQFEGVLLLMCVTPKVEWQANKPIPGWVMNVWEQVFKMCPMPKPMKLTRKPRKDDEQEMARYSWNLMCGGEAAIWARIYLLCHKADEKADGYALTRIKEILSHVWEDAPLRSVKTWMEGYAFGLNAQFLDENGRPLRATSAYPVYRVFLEHWPEIKTPMTVPDLHAWLENYLPQFKTKDEEQKIKNCQSLQQLCRRIKFPQPSRGCPAKKVKKL
jgi:hypothetical protein